MNDRPADSTASGLCDLRIPAAPFLAFDGAFFPSSCIRSQYLSKSPIIHTTSPRISLSPGFAMERGIPFTRRAFSHTESPTLSLPRVTASHRTPSLYIRARPSPSILYSRVTYPTPWSRFIPDDHSFASSMPLALEMDIIGTSCRTFRNPDAPSDTFLEGDVSRIRPGFSASNCFIRRYSASKVASSTSGAPAAYFSVHPLRTLTREEYSKNVIITPRHQYSKNIAMKTSFFAIFHQNGEIIWKSRQAHLY